MPRTLHLRVEGETEKFLEEMNKLGLNDRDAIAKGLGMLNLVYTTGRVALLRPNAEASKAVDKLVDYVFTLGELESSFSNKRSKSFAQKKTSDDNSVG